MALANGTVLGPYEILSPLGAGGMGEVYRARDTRLEREVAVKVLPEAFAEDPERMARFERETKLLASLNHPNIVTVFAVEETAGGRFLIMEYLDGKALADLIPTEGMPLPRFFEIAVPLSEALTAAHDQGVVHRDLKPANVMVGGEGQVKVLDFGLAKAVAAAPAGGAGSSLPTQAPPSRPLTEAGERLGTPDYMAPEQLRGEGVDARADVFSLGVVLYEMLTGSRPFAGSSAPEVLSSVLRDTPALVTELRPEAPVHLARLVRRCLEKDPELRIQTSKDVRNELRELARPTANERTERQRTGRQTAQPALTERGFTLTTTLLRGLSNRPPRLVGRTMSYLDNQVASPTLVVLVHGLGTDQSQFEQVLASLPVRAVAPTLVGFEPSPASRPVISLDDHSRLLRAFLRDATSRLRPAHTILVGFSSGADQCLRLVASDDGPGAPLAGLIALGPNADLSTCFFSRRVAGLCPDEPGEVLETLKDLGREMTSLGGWLTLHKYVVESFTKLAGDFEILKRYAEDVVAPFEAGGDPLARWFRLVSERVPNVRLIFGHGNDAAAAEALLGRHLEHNVLGDRFTETTVVLEPLHHTKLADPEVVIRHVLEAVEAAGGE